MDKAEQAAGMRELREQGWTLKAIAERFGVSISTVDRRLAPHFETGTNGGAPVRNEQTAEMWAAWVGGKSQIDIAREHNITQQSVSERLCRFREQLPDPERDTVLRRCLDQIDLLQKPLLDLVSGTPPPAYSNGRAMKDDEGKAVPDWSVIISAATSVLRTQERLAKFLGLDAPAKAEVLHLEAATEAAKAEAEAALEYLGGGEGDGAGDGG